MTDKVTPAEIVEALRAYDKAMGECGYELAVDDTIADRIEQHGIAPPDVDCNTCANRGKTDGLSQESHCEHCVFEQTWRTNHYAPKVKP